LISAGTIALSEASIFARSCVFLAEAATFHLCFLGAARLLLVFFALHQYNKQQSGLIAILIIIIITTTRQTYTTLTSILLKISSLLHRHQTAFSTLIIMDTNTNTAMDTNMDTNVDTNMDTNTNTAIDNVCAVCPRPGKLCSVCKDIYYCCRSHQKDDWPIHKLVCKKLALRPLSGTVLALYFPGDGTEPTTTRFLSFQFSLGPRPALSVYLGCFYGEDLPSDHA
jgi:hypothetical protein